MSIATLVEGDGEVAALPVLLRRFVAIANPPDSIDIQPPIRLPSEAFLDPAKLLRMLRIAEADREERHLTLILRDADDHCPVALAARISGAIAEAILGADVFIVVAQSEYESWFIAAAPSLAGKRGLPENLDCPGNHEAIRGAKEWIADRMPVNRKYHETRDQPAFTQAMDLTLARQNRSFRRLHDRVLAFLRGA